MGEDPRDLPADVSVPIETSVNLPMDQLSPRAQDYRDNMRKVLQRVVKLQELAAQQDDVIRLNCLNDVLLQLREIIKLAESASTSLEEAIARNADSDARFEFGRITVANERAEQLAAEAEACLGDDTLEFGTTVDVDPGPNTDVDIGSPSVPSLPPIEPIPPGSPTT